MLVSIILPNYNKEKYLAECLDSCLAQDKQVVKEIIVVDDHSTDRSWAILQEYQARHPIIKVFKNPKKGAQIARNFGLEQATGKYINWMDSDDVISADKVKAQVDLLEVLPPNSIAFCSIVEFQHHIEGVTVKVYPSWKNYPDPIDFLIEGWQSKDSMQVHRWLIPTTIANQLRWDESLLKNQDGLYCFQMVLAASALFFSEKGLVYHRIPQSKDANISLRTSVAAAQSELYVYQQYEKILEIRNAQKWRDALYMNYMSFLYRHTNRHPELAAKAKARIKALGFQKLAYKVSRFGDISSWLGFENTLRLRKVFKGY